jgi:hypothetical protein
MFTIDDTLSPEFAGQYFTTGNTGPNGSSGVVVGSTGSGSTGNPPNQSVAG